MRRGVTPRRRVYERVRRRGAGSECPRRPPARHIAPRAPRLLPAPPSAPRPPRRPALSPRRGNVPCARLSSSSVASTASSIRRPVCFPRPAPPFAECLPNYCEQVSTGAVSNESLPFRRPVSPRSQVLCKRRRSLSDRRAAEGRPDYFSRGPRRIPRPDHYRAVNARRRGLGGRRVISGPPLFPYRVAPARVIVKRPISPEPNELIPGAGVSAGGTARAPAFPARSHNPA